MAKNKNEEVARLAYELYEKSGWQHGRHEEHWFEAERLMTARSLKVAGRGAAKPAKKPAKKAAVASNKGVAAKARTKTGTKTGTKPRKQSVKATV